MEKRIRHSHQRDMIYQYLLSSKEHPSADMIYDHLRADNPNLSLGTVYRNLKLLEELGQVRRVTTLQNAERYDADCTDHAHFVCRQCGCVKDLPPIDSQWEKELCPPEPGDRVEWVHLVFGGVCSACGNKKQ